jgi:hypothetical protein
LPWQPSVSPGLQTHACVVLLLVLLTTPVELASVVVPLIGPVVLVSVVPAVVPVPEVPVLPELLSLTPVVVALPLPSGPAVVGTLSVAEPVPVLVLALALTLTLVLATDVSVSRVPSSPQAAARIRSGTMGKGKKLRMRPFCGDPWPTASRKRWSADVDRAAGCGALSSHGGPGGPAGQLLRSSSTTQLT